jgi:hypothetical protein
MGLDMFLNRVSDNEEVGYWRKANAIHGWIVQNVQDGKDECQQYIFSKEKMTELLELCYTVLSDIHNKSHLLPTTSGFFFGNYEVDDWYIDSLMETIDILEECLDNPSEEYIYQASW